MQRRNSTFAAAALLLAMAAPLSADEPPGPLATPAAKLDYLLSRWRGQSVARVREVFGREDESQLRGGNPVLVYERRVKVRPTLGGIAVHPNGGLRCVVRFLIGDDDKVARVAREGGGAECWNVWRKYEP